MASHVVLLRAVNVGGASKLTMADLRSALEQLGHRDVETYVQSGNAVLTAADPAITPEGLGADIAAAIARVAGFAPPTLVLTTAEFEAIVAAGPYPEQAARAPKEVHALILPEAPGALGEQQLADALQRAGAKGSEDHGTLIDRTFYLHTPGGIGRSALATALTSRRSSVAAAGTARNWATMRKLREMAGT